jgi:hypothetical protein
MRRTVRWRSAWRSCAEKHWNGAAISPIEPAEQENTMHPHAPYRSPLAQRIAGLLWLAGLPFHLLAWLWWLLVASGLAVLRLFANGMLALLGLLVVGKLYFDLGYVLLYPLFAH